MHIWKKNVVYLYFLAWCDQVVQKLSAQYIHFYAGKHTSVAFNCEKLKMLVLITGNYRTAILVITELLYMNCTENF